MNPVIIRGVAIGEGIPKICVPIVGKTREEIIREAEKATELDIDIVEWRADWSENVFDREAVKSVLQELRSILGETPLLFTFRTKREGGERDITETDYAALNQAVAESGLADLIDIEVFMGEDIIAELIQSIHACGGKIVGSNHDFQKTPEKEEIIRRLRQMQDLGADIPKIAVMPRNKQDVLTLLAATEEMSCQYADRPIITMSMAETGVISRISGEVFGSALTFGSAGQVSAPGQPEVKELRQMLEILHRSL